MTTIAFANPDSQISGYYRAGSDGDIGEWVRGKLDQAIDEWKPLRLVFDDDTDDYEQAYEAAYEHIQRRGYYRIYQYTTTTAAEVAAAVVSVGMPFWAG